MEESIIIKSTYKDNPFFPDSIKRQIEDLKRTDEALYQIYALGEKAISKSNIYSNWTFVKHRPSRFVNFVYGIDFGYNHPTALMRVYYCENDIYIEPVIYESYLTTTNLIARMDELSIEKYVTIVADYARPEIIAEMNNAGYDVMNANKVVKKGIDNIKTFGVWCQDDPRVKKEYENYKWKKVGDLIMDEPVKLYDDAMDAIRYATTHIRQEYYTDDSYFAF
jgi:phage terminase large subunit